jgi:hypothetical protein
MPNRGKFTIVEGLSYRIAAEMCGRKRTANVVANADLARRTRPKQKGRIAMRPSKQSSYG